MRRCLFALVCVVTSVAAGVGLMPAAVAATSADAAHSADRATAAHVATSATPAAGFTSTPGLPSAVPAAFTPWVQDGSVQQIVQVGNMLIAGGNFTTVAARGGTPTYSRTGLFAFDATTGAISTTFDPVFNGVVNALLPGPTPNTIYVGGAFTTVNGTTASHVVVLDATTGAVVSSFRAAVSNGSVQTLAQSGSHLFLGGYFTTVGGAAHVGIASIDASTGLLDPYVNLQMSVHHNNAGSGAQGGIGATDMVVNPQNDRLAVIGNFKIVDGLSRDQLVMVTLGATAASVTPDWATTRYSPLCFNWAYDSDVRGVAFSPDGSWFVVTATGGSSTGALCDSAARWETYASGTNLQPTWVDYTGRDTVWGVAITNSVVFIGGHNRWMNNQFGVDSPGQGAVPRPGLSALDPQTGEPLDWNPGRNPRGVSAKEFYPTNAGIWMGMDTSYVGNYQYKRPRIAFFPYAGGRPVVSNATGSLPGTAFLGGSASTPSTSVAQVSVGSGGTTASVAGAIATSDLDWSQVRGAFMVGTRLYYGYTDGYLYRRDFDGTTFGPAVKVDPYHDPNWATVQTGSGQTYSGTLPTVYSQLGTVTGMAYANGRLYFTRSGSSTLSWVAFSPDSGIMNPAVNTLTGGFNWSRANGMFIAGSTLYVASSTDGSLNAVTLVGGGPSGSSVVVNGPATGGLDWRAKGLFLSSATANLPPTASFAPTCTNMSCAFDATSASDQDGTIVSYSWDFGDGGTGTGVTPSYTYTTPGTHTVTLTVTDNSGASTSTTHQVSVQPPVDVPPTASFTGVCSGLDCSFDGSASKDADGSIAAYSWSFGDGSTASGATTTHTYATQGSYLVTLTVTDNQGVSSSTTQSFTVAMASGVAYRGAASYAGSTNKPSVTAPAGVSAGDQLLLVLSTASAGQLATPPPGWSLLGTKTAGSLATTVWTRIAQAGDASRKVAVTLATSAKVTLTIADYTGTSLTVQPTFAAASDTTTRASHTTPLVHTVPNSWVVSYWADKGAGTTSWTTPGSVVARSSAVGTLAGHVSSLLADSAGSAATPTYGQQTATANAATGMATMWSIELAPAGATTPPPNQPPTAAFGAVCSDLACTLDGSGSSDPDGSVVSYAWSLGDGATGTGATTSHTWSGTGTYPVTLTVTDDQGAQASVTHDVTVTAPAPVLAFRGAARFAGSATKPTVTIPAADGVGDTLLLFFSTASPGQLITAPTGWTSLGTSTAGTLGTTVWSRTAVAGDAGKKVTVTLPATAKVTLTVAGWSGTNGAAPVAANRVETTSGAAHTTPGVPVAAGDWVVSYWADKNAGTSTWNAPAVTNRASGFGTLSGHVSSLLADSGGPVSGTSYAGQVATANAAAAMATMWSVVLVPGQ